MRAKVFPKFGVPLTMALLAVTWTSASNAHPGYPAIVDTTLGLSGDTKLETVLPPMGCQLCHNSSAGGDALRMFGNLMVENYGLSPSLAEADSSLDAALVLLQMDNPEAVKDLKAGVNPNDDAVVFQNALPSPEHGCSAGGAGGSSGLVWAGLVALFAFGRTRRRAA